MEVAELALKVDSRGFVRADRDLDKFSKTAGRADQAAQKMAASAQRLGRTLSLSVTAPLVAAAAASARMGAQFDSELTKINTLVGVSREEIAGFRAEILRLAPALGRQPQEMASALFAVTSAGLRGAEAMQTLEAASKAAAIGLGDTRSVALAATAAVTAYGRENLNASEAVEILVGTIEQGNVAAEEVAPVLGRVIGIAAELGVTFDEVGGFIASFTRLGVDAAEATTALRGALSTIQKPTKETEETFAALESSVGEFRQQIIDEGFTNAMQNLVNRSRELNVDLSALFPNVRALSGVLGVFGGEADAAQKITQGVGDAVGTLDRRFQDLIEQDPAFAFEQMKASLSTLLIEISANVLPAVLDLVGIIRDLTESFRQLEPETQRNVVKMAAFAAAIGPLLIAGGLLISSLRGIAGALIAVRAASIGTSGAIASMIALEKALGATSTSAAAASVAMKTFTRALPLIGAVSAITGGIVLLVAAIRDQREELELMRQPTDDAAEAADRAARALDRLRDSADKELNPAFLNRAKSEIEALDTGIEELEARIERIQRVAASTGGLGGRSSSRIGPRELEALQERLRAEQDLRDVQAARLKIIEQFPTQTERTAAAQELLNGLFFEAESILGDLGIKLKTAENGTKELGDEAKKAVVKIKFAEVGVESFRDTLNNLSADAFFDAISQAREMADAIADLNDEIADASAELGGPLARNLRNFQREVQRIAQLPVPEALKAERIELLREEFDRTNIEIRDGLIRTFEDAISGAIPEFIAGMLGIGDATRKAANEVSLLSQIGSNFAQSVIQGQSSGDALASSLRAIAGRDAIENVGKLFEDGLNLAFEKIGLSESATKFFESGGASMAAAFAAQAIEGIQLIKDGQTFAGIGSFFGEFGKVIGSFLDGIFEDDPRFELFSLPGGSNLQPGRSDFFDTAFGEQAVRFRDFGEEAEAEFIQAFQELDRTLASVLRGNQFEAVQQALQDFEFDSRVSGQNIEDIFEQRTEAVIDALFDGAIAGFVKSAGDIDAQIQRIADVFAIENQLLLGRGFGIDSLAGGISPEPSPSPFPPGFGGGGGGGGGGVGPPGQRLRPNAEEVATFNAVISGVGDAADVTNDSLLATLTLLDELAIGNESLQQTFARLTGAVDTLDTVAALTGSQLSESREGLVRFGADLVRIFGDDAEALADQFGIIFESFFSDEERFIAASDAARARGRDLLESLLSGIEGVDFAERFLTQSGFRELFDSLIDSGLTPEQLAVLSEAGVSIAGLIEAEQALADARGDTTSATIEQLAELEREIGDSIFEALSSDFRIAFRNIGREFAELTDRAIELGASQQTLERIERLRAIRLNELTVSLRASLQDLTELLFGSDTTDQQIGQINQVAEARNNAFEKELRALERIGSFIDSALLSGVSPLVPGQRVAEARSQLEEAFAAAEAGDLTALENLPALADQFFREFSAFTGGVGDFPDEFDDVLARLQELQDAGPQNQPSSTRPPSALDFSSGINRLTEELTELQRVSATFDLVDQIGLLSQITEQTPSDIAAQLGVPLNEVIRTLTGEVPGLIGDDLSGFFNDLVAETNASLNELGLIESLAVTRNELLGQMLGEIKNIEPPEQFAGPAPEPGPTADGSFVPTAPPTSTGGQNATINIGEIERRLDQIALAISEGNNQRREGNDTLKRAAVTAERSPFLNQPSRGRY